MRIRLTLEITRTPKPAPPGDPIPYTENHGYADTQLNPEYVPLGFTGNAPDKE